MGGFIADPQCPRDGFFRRAELIDLTRFDEAGEMTEFEA
jgi:hypothetical protein